MAGRPPLCPACGEPVDDAWCASCGLELSGDEAATLRDLATQLAEAESELNTAWARRDALAEQLAGRRWQRVSVASGAPPAARPVVGASVAPPSPARVAPEWNGERVRNFLLWGGATLLAFSALTFTAVAWTHLGPGGRAALLFAVTVVVGIGACAAKNRLPATSGALTGLTIALALIDAQILRRAGVASGLSSVAWWAFATAAVALASLLFGRVAAAAPARRAAVLLLPTSAVLMLGTIADAAWSAALGFSMLSAVLVLADRAVVTRIDDPALRFVLRVEAVLVWVVAALAALAAAVLPSSFVETLVPAAAFASLAIAPGIALRYGSSAAQRVWLGALVIASGFAAALVLPSTSIGGVGEVTAAAFLACVALAVAPSFGKAWRAAMRCVGLVAVVPGALVAALAASVAELGPLSWFAAPWTGEMSLAAQRAVSGPDTTELAALGWCAVAILVGVAVTIPFAARVSETADETVDPLVLRSLSVGLLLVALVLVPVAADASAAVAWAVSLAATGALVAIPAFAVRDSAGRARAFGGLAVVTMIPAAGWSAMTSTASIVALSIVVVTASTAVVIGRVAGLRAAHAALAAVASAMLVAVIILAAGGDVSTAGFGAATAAGTLLVLGSQLRRNTADGIALESVGVLGIVVGALLAAPSTPWLAATLTVAVPFFAGAAVRSRRRVAYGAAAGAAALSATWAWLAVADVRVVEAYTFPAAVAALAAGTFARRGAHTKSWLTLGPAIVLALGPTLALAITRDDDTRAILIGGAALAVLLAGASRRLQAPIVLGGVALLALGVDKLGPQAARLPRWLMLALAGSILLWVGTTFERRRADVQRARRGFERLG